MSVLRRAVAPNFTCGLIKRTEGATVCRLILSFMHFFFMHGLTPAFKAFGGARPVHSM